MSAPNPQTIAAEITSEVCRLLLGAGRYLSDGDPTWVHLHDECSKLQKVDVVLASRLKADLYVLLGDIDQARYWATNARNNGDRFGAEACIGIGYANLGFVSKAASIYAPLLTVKAGQINELFPHGISCGCFSVMVDAAKALTNAGGTVADEELHMKAHQASEALSQLGVTEATLQSMMDEAGSLLREKKLLWLHRYPDLLTSHRGESPYVTVNYRVDVPPREAAEMTWLLAEKLASLDLTPFGVTVGFVGSVASKGKTE